jgi:hypothetical protein
MDGTDGMDAMHGQFWGFAKFFSHERVRKQMSAPPNTADVPSATNVTIADSHQPIIVNLRAAIDASAEVAVFGPSEERVSNVVWCDVSLNVAGLYDGSQNAMFEFWETAAEPGAFNAQIATGRDASAVALTFAQSLAAVLQGGMDASAANPFQNYGQRAYDHYDSFGDLALAYAAEGMFGHPSATAAITNDDEIINGFNSDTSASDGLNGETPTAPTQTNQALAHRLAHALLHSSGTVATQIARQVLGQDASRATNEDNSERKFDEKAALRFYENDVVYVAITLNNFVASVGSASGVLAQQYSPVTPTAETYYLRIRLANA